MNYERVIIDIKKAIKEHLDNNYAYDMLVNFELDVIDWNSLFEYINKLQKDNKKLKERIKYLERSNNRREDTILEQRQKISDLEDNWNKLKEYIYNQIPTDKTVFTKHIKIFEVLDKMQEIEQGSDSNVKD